MEMESSFRICTNPKSEMLQKKTKFQQNVKNTPYLVCTVCWLVWGNFTTRENGCKNEPVWKTPWHIHIKVSPDCLPRKLKLKCVAYSLVPSRPRRFRMWRHPSSLSGKFARAIALGSKPPPVTWIARSGLCTRLRRVIISAIVSGVAPVSYWPIFPLCPQ